MGLVDIKTRIEVAASTRKITQALQLVAANKMRHYQRQALACRTYVNDLVEALGMASAELAGFWLAERRDAGKTLFVLVTSNKGLCGTLNQRQINHLFASSEWSSLPPDERMLATVGRKGRDAARRLGMRVDMEFDAVGENLKAVESLGIVGRILDLWESGEVKRVALLSPHYVNPFTSVPMFRPLLPLSSELMAGVSRSAEQFTGRTPYLEPDGPTVIRQLGMQLMEALMTQAFYDLKASEYSSRMVAMKKASDAAEEMVGALTLEYNRTRQSIITQQLAELAAASEAMSGPAAGRKRQKVTTT